ncbi:hypothetical protein pb186bvf_012698 [Paramecium bursaria]
MLRKLFLTTYKFCTKYPNGQQQTNQKSFPPTFSFDVISHFDQVCKIKGSQNLCVTILPCYPQYQITNKNQIVVRQKFNKNFIYLWRIHHDEGNKDAINFPLSYELCADLMDFGSTYQQKKSIKLEESTYRGMITLEVEINANNKAQISISIIFKDPQLQRQSQSTEISIPQFKLLVEQMRQGLTIVTGWQIPYQFLNEYKKEE